MKKHASYNILMYSHDTYGLGHIRRTMAIAEHLRGKDVNILILTGSPIAGRFKFPDRVDFVRIPGMIKMTNKEYRPLSIKIDPDHALDIRTSIITSTARAFRPDLFIVDKEPLGLKKEVLPTLEWLKGNLPRTRTILGLRDIMDDAQTVKEDWREKGVYQILDTLYSEIWVYGNRALYDPISEYSLNGEVSKKVHFTGYIPRKVPDPGSVQNIRKDMKIKEGDKLVVVTTGGGGDGFGVMDNYLSMLEAETAEIPFKSILVTGPFMPKKKRKLIGKRSRQLKLRTFHFYRRMEHLMAAADLVISMGGYNTICEILSQKKVSLIIPREIPRQEQLIRAKVMNSRNLVDYIPWENISARSLREKVFYLLNNPDPIQKAICGFALTGLDSMRQRIESFRDENRP